MKMKTIIGYVSLVFLAYLFITHGVQALLQNPGFLSLVTSAGFSYNVAKILLVVVGVLDVLVALLLFVYRVPLVVMYAGVWPLVPATMYVVTTGHFSFIDFIVAPFCAVLIYYVFFGWRFSLGK